MSTFEIVTAVKYRRDTTKTSLEKQWVIMGMWFWLLIGSVSVVICRFRCTKADTFRGKNSSEQCGIWAKYVIGSIRDHLSITCRFIQALFASRRYASGFLTSWLYLGDRKIVYDLKIYLSGTSLQSRVSVKPYWQDIFERLISVIFRHMSLASFIDIMFLFSSRFLVNLS